MSQKRCVLLLTVGAAAFVTALCIATWLSHPTDADRVSNPIPHPGASVVTQLIDVLEKIEHRPLGEDAGRDEMQVPMDWIPHEFNGMRFYIIPVAERG